MNNDNKNSPQMQDVQTKSDCHPICTPFAPQLQPPTPCNSGVTPRTYEGKLYYGAEDVAKIIGVSRIAVLKWHHRNLFTADIKTHDGIYLYEIERVMQLKAVYHPKWTRGGYEPAPVDEKQSRIAEPLNLFNKLYGKIPAGNFVYLGTKQQGRLFFNHSFMVDDVEAMARKAIELSDCGVDVWHAVNPVNVEPKDGRRGDETAVSFQTAVVVDIDIQSAAHKGDPSLLAADFDEAKSFLPFTPSLIIHSSYGLHAYYIWAEPLAVTDANREEIKRRNNLLLDVVRQKANGKKIDGVGDLPRILRTPGTFNYKLGKDHAPLCHVVEDSGLRFAPNDIDEKLNALIIPTSPSETQSKPMRKNDIVYFDDDPNLKEFRISRMLDYINVVDGEYEKWLSVGFALFNEGMELSVWEQWSRNQPEFKEGECEYKWNGFHHDPNGISIASLYQWATEGGYVETDIRREYYQLNPKLKPSAKRNMDEGIKCELDDAIIWLDTLEPENFTADDARSLESIHKVALAAVFGFSSAVENFFKTIKDAKTIAKNKIKENDADLTKKLTIDELNKLNALVEGINIKFLRSEVEREITQIKRAQNEFHAQQTRDRTKAQAIKHAKEREQTVEDNIQHLIKLREEYRNNPSKELAAQIQNLILHTCDVKIDRYTGKTSAVRATQANADLIFSFDPILDGLFGYDQFQQADVFLKAPPWAINKNNLPVQKNNYISDEVYKFNLLFKGTEWTDRDDANLQTYIRRHYVEFASDKLVLKNITSYSDKRAFHEVKEFFHNLPKWDGKKRAEKIFVKFLGADDSPYVREVTLNILTAAVARIFHPGCDYQLAPILLGEQGIGKSHILGKLFGKWYGSLVDDVSDPHAIDAVQRLWGVEIKEMAAMKKDVDANKRFIDSAKDTRRQAYARRATTIPRHCVFFITTNNKMCLTDMTGNRRYPIIVCHNKARHYVEIPDGYIAQVWAEVFAHYNKLFKDGFDEKKLELSRDSQIQSDEIAEDYLRDDGMESEIRAYLDTKILPLILWFLLTREERRDFIKNGRLVMLDAVSEFNHRRRARGGKDATVQRDVDLISSCLAPAQNKHWLRIETIQMHGRTVDQYTLYGSVLRQHICAVEIYNECFGNDKRKSPTRINEILHRIEGWSLGADISKSDPAYLRQRKVFYREEN